MGRYVHENDEWDESRQALWDNAVRRATYSKRGQAVLRELKTALLSLPEPRLIDGLLCDGTGVCTVGAIGAYRMVQGGMSWGDAFKALDESGDYDTEDGDYGSIDETARYGQRSLKMAFSLAWNLAYRNDELLDGVTPERRYALVLSWVRSNLVPPPGVLSIPAARRLLHSATRDTAAGTEPEGAALAYDLAMAAGCGPYREPAWVTAQAETAAGVQPC